MTAIPVIDTDTHLSELPDLWTSRVSAKKWGDAIPRPIFDERRGAEIWVIGKRRTSGVSGYANAGWHEYPPRHPKTIEAADPAAFYAKDRIARMDREGIAAEVLYPNLLAFSMDAFMDLDPALTLECVRAYNDFLVDFASVSPDRFILLTTLPFWDLDASVAEIARCYDKGHRGIVFMTKPYKFGLPRLSDDYWSPILSAAEERGMTVNFHVGYQSQNQDDWKRLIKQVNDPADYAHETTLSLMGLAEGVSEILFGGVCHKYPDINFINVESGFGWIPYLLESADWNWANSGAHKQFPDRELPSFYFRRQVYSTYWFERETVKRMADLYQDNLMFETDFPHPTSLSPGPASTARGPRQVVDDTLEELPEAVCRKIFFENAARLYHVEAPAGLF